MMGCLLGCFNASKHQRRPKSAQISPSKPQSQARAFLPAGSTEKTDTEALIEVKTDSRVSDEKQLEQLSHGKKKVAFDLNVKIHEVLPAVEEEVGIGDVWIEVKEARERGNESVSRSTSIESNGSSCALNNRYTNCASSDEKLGGTDLEEIDVKEDGVEDDRVGVCGGEIAAQEESSESLFSLSIDSRKHFSIAEVGEKEVSSPFPVKSASRNELNSCAFNQSARLSSDDELGGADLEEIDVEEDDVKDDGVGVCGGEVAAQQESSESLFSLSIDSRKQFLVTEVGEKEVSSPLPVKSSSRNERNRSAFNQRARLSSDDERGGIDVEEIDVEEDGVKDDGVGVCGGEIAAQQESSESLFSLSIDSRKHFFIAEVGENEVKSPFPVKSSSRNELNRSAFNQSARLRSEHVDAVLSPVENLPQRKAVVANSPVKNQDKENVHKEQEVLLSTGPKPTFTPANHLCKPSPNHSRFIGKEIAVDISLSSWLVDSDATTKSKCSNDSVGNSPSERASTPRRDKVQPVVGVPIAEDLRQFSASTSLRLPRGWTPEKPPVLGTVGRYWSHTGQVVE